MIVCCHQTDPIRGEIDANFAALHASILAHQADIHVFPELALTGYFFSSKADLSACVQTINGDLIQRLSTIAKENNTAICTGFAEVEDGRFYNSSVLIDATGTLVSRYRKVHLFDREKLLFEPGDLGFPVVTLNLADGSVIVGMMICYDWRFPEAARSLALGGAQLICVPSNIVTTTEMRMPTRRTRAFENKVYIAYADRVGIEETIIDGNVEQLIFRGCSSIIAPNGDVLTSLNETETASILAEIAPERTDKKSFNSRNDIFSDRRPETYRS